MSNKIGAVLYKGMMAKPHTQTYILECDFDNVVDTIISGLVYTEVAKKFNVSMNVVIHFTRKYNLKPHIKRKFRSKNYKRKIYKSKTIDQLRKNKELIIELFKQDVSYEKIAEQLNVCTNSLHYYCKKENIQKAQFVVESKKNLIPHIDRKCICCGKEFVPGKPTKDNVTLTRLCLNCYTNGGNISGMDVFDECQIGLPKI